MPDHLDGFLRDAAHKIEKLDAEVAETRTTLVDFGVRIQSLIDAFPESDVARIGLRVHLVTRGTPLPPAETKLEVKALPSNEDAVPRYEYEEPGEYEHEQGDEDGELDPRARYEMRPGASSLFLEAFGEGKNRFYFEIRCIPGVCVLADLQSEVMKKYLEALLRSESVCGIKVMDGTPRLVFGERDRETVAGFTPQGLLGGFLQGANVVLDWRLRNTNRG